MLLETLDIKKDDIVIYSQNIYNNEKNFRIVYKDDAVKQPHQISYDEVCLHVNEYSPKNLIVYRLLTNIKDFEMYIPKNGILLNINGAKEVIFFDPVYAVREIEEYSKNLDYNRLRFRIQQVGLTTLNRIGDLPNYAEIYSIDLEATEAKFQNDKVFADAIFSSSELISVTEKEPEKISRQPVKEKLNVKNPEPTAGLPKKEERKPEKAATEVKNKTVGEPVKKNIEEPTVAKKADEISQKQDTIEGKEQTFVRAEREAKFAKRVTEVPDEDAFPVDSEINKENRPAIQEPVVVERTGGIRILSHDISEDKNFDYKEIMKIKFKVPGQEVKKVIDAPIPASQNISKPGKQKDTGTGSVKGEQKPETLFGKYLKESTSNKTDKKIPRQPGDEKVSQVLDMFKSSSSKYVNDRANKQIVLKLDENKQS